MLKRAPCQECPLESAHNIRGDFRGGFGLKIMPSFRTSHMRGLLRESVPMALVGLMLVAAQKGLKRPV